MTNRSDKIRRHQLKGEHQRGAAIGLASKIEVLEHEAHNAGLTILAHGLNRAKNAAGWLAAGEPHYAAMALDGKRPGKIDR